jgi:excisionase family DNA binding protein
MIANDQFSLPEAANFLGVSPKYLQQLCRKRRIEYIRIHRTNWQFTQKSLDTYLARQTVEALQPLKKVDHKYRSQLHSRQGIEIKENDKAALRKELSKLCQ